MVAAQYEMVRGTFPFSTRPFYLLCPLLVELHIVRKLKQTPAILVGVPTGTAPPFTAERLYYRTAHTMCVAKGPAVPLGHHDCALPHTGCKRKLHISRAVL